MTSQTALITGGASGIGKNLANSLHSKGNTLIIADINEEVGQAYVKELNAIRPDSAFFKHVDVSNWESQVDLYKYIASIPSIARLDHVFPNAGVLETTYLPATSPTTVEYIKPDIKTLDVDLTGVLYTANLAAQVFRTQPLVDGVRGRIVVTASIAAFSVIPNMPLYSAAKHALLGFVRSFGLQLESEGITVNAVAPNITRSGLTTADYFDNVEAQGYLTSSDAVTRAFEMFLGESKLTAHTATVSLEQIDLHGPTEPFGEAGRVNIAGLRDFHGAYYKTLWPRKEAEGVEA